MMPPGLARRLSHALARRLSRALAGRMSRALVGRHPRRWRERYGEEMLDVLDQHHPTARTVASLAGSMLSTHLDPAYRTERLSLSRLRRVALKSAAIAAPVVLVLGSLFGYAVWRERWQLSGAGGVGGVSFAPGQHLMVSAAGSAGQNNEDALFDITDPARPRLLSAFQGGEPTVLSPGGRILATVSDDGQPALWDVADPRRPARIAVLPAGGNAPLWGEALSPGGQTLAVAYTDRIFLWNVATAARPRLLGTLAAPVTPAGKASFTPQDITFSPDGRILASVDGTGQVTLWNVTDPARATRIATLNGLRDYVEAIAFSPDGALLAGVTYYGTVGLFSLAGPARPALTTTISGIMARALYPDGLLQHPDAPPCPSCSPASYAVTFTPDGRTLTVVVARQEGNVTGAAFTINTRDTVFMWDVTSSGMVSDLTTVTHDGDDIQPTLAPDGRTVADGSYTSNAVSLWTAP